MAKKQQPDQAFKIEPKSSKKTVLILIGVALLIIAVAGTYFLYAKQQTDKKLASAQLGANEVDALIKKVGKVIELPQGETPTIATVSDINKLKNQVFFKNAQNGDKVLIYQNAKKAILYRPSTNKIIEVGPIAVQPSPAATATASAEVKQITATILNGTTTSGLGGQTRTKLTEKYPNITVNQVGNAAETDYKNTLVVDISGQNKAFAAEVAEFLGGQVGSLPDGETKPDTDILIISAK